MKQKTKIHESIKTKSAHEIADDLNVGYKAVQRYIKTLTAKPKKDMS